MQKYAAAVLLIYLGTAVLFQGFFYETGHLFSTTALCLACLPVAIHSARRGFCAADAALLVIVLLYWASCLFAVDRERALLEAFKWTGALPLVLLFRQLDSDGFKRILHVWAWLGLMLTAVGIAFGLERAGRLESTLDYANATAIFLLGSVLAGILLFLRERTYVLLLLIAVSSAGLLLTMSRSVWVLWLAAGIAVIFLFRAVRSKKVFLQIAAAHIAGFAAAALVKADPLFFWQRVQSIRPQTSEFRIRLVYWRDSLHMILDYPWFGSGGGGWAALLPAYRSQDYFVRYVHNHYLQITLDAGLIALLAFLVWIASAYVKGFRKLGSHFTPESEKFWVRGGLLLFTVLLLHAGFDFDLGFPLLVALLAGLHHTLTDSGGEFAKPRLSSKPVVAALAASLILCAAASGWLGAGCLKKQEGAALVRAGRLPEAQVKFADAARMLPWHHTPHYEAAKAYVLAGNQSGDTRFYRLAEQELDSAIRLAPKEDLYRSLQADLNKALPTEKSIH